MAQVPASKPSAAIGGGTAASAGARPTVRPGPSTRWNVRLLGTVEASDSAQTLQRFPSRAVAALPRGWPARLNERMRAKS